MASPRPASLRVASRGRTGGTGACNSNSVFSGLSSDIQNDLIKSIAQVIRDEIKSEINFAKFVSVIADETPDISHREQMSVIFRYLTKTGIEEICRGSIGRNAPTSRVTITYDSAPRHLRLWLGTNSRQTRKPSVMSKVVKTIVTSPHVYKPVGPYSQAVLAGKMLYVSGVLGLDEEARLVAGGAAAEARRALENLARVLEAGGSSLPAVVKTTVLLKDINTFPDVNKIYAEYFPKHCPARATYEVGKLPMDAAVEIEAIALSGVLGLDPEGHLAPCGAEGQTKKALENLVHILDAAGTSLDCVVKTTILLTNMHDFGLVNKVYRDYFPQNCPARATFQVGKLPLGASVEIEAIAVKGEVTVQETAPCPCSEAKN
ncbi:RutC family protein UK114 [Eumeta japonica]|uniref:RutC family protein UK114 n=1 Tax=Eumeta variegata TaxID=151549 RepID=A0A4C1YZ44_EUMVA|nr:RutC family protein UK114 [Eumeta japonica]